MPQCESSPASYPTAQGIERPYTIQGGTLRSKLNKRADRLRYKVAHGSLKMECGGMTLIVPTTGAIVPKGGAG